LLHRFFEKEPDQLSPKLGPTSRTLEKDWIFNSPLTYYDFQNAVQPVMAERIPTRHHEVSI
jgi:hypothetical protein